MTFEQQIASILADRESGSSQLVVQIEEAFLRIENTDPDPTQLQWALMQLRQIDCSMAVVHHLLDTLESALGSDFYPALHEYERSWCKLPQRVAEQLLQTRDWRNSHILIHSRSGMLLAAARYISERHEGLTIWQTRSDPGGEGVAQYRDLQPLNLTVHLVEDSQVAELADSMDAAWLGVDQYTDETFVNKVGSKCIVSAMSRAGKTTFVLGDPRKRVQTLDFSPTLFEAVAFTRDTCLMTGGHALPA